MTDLVCLSSACPDDIDPANGWNPTEVHVRVYPATERFSTAIAHRVTPDAEPKLTKETAFHPRTSRTHAALHRVQRLLAADRVRQPRRRRRVLGVSRARGDHGSVAAAQVGDPRPGRGGAPAGDDDARHPPARRRPGRLHGAVQRHGRDDRRRHRLPASRRRTSASSAAPSTTASGCASRRSALGLRVWIKESTDELHNVAVQGPASRELLTPLIWTPPTQTPFAELKWFRFSIARHRRAAGDAARSPRARATRASSATSSSATRRTRPSSGTR